MVDLKSGVLRFVASPKTEYKRATLSLRYSGTPPCKDIESKMRKVIVLKIKNLAFRECI